MERREFLGWISLGTLASTLPVAIAACTPRSSNPNAANPARSDGFQAVGTVAELDKTGQILDEQFAGSKVLVVRNPGDPNQAIAVNPTCTHAGCTVAWQKDQQRFVCPCHNSQFAADGKVIRGPAKAPLANYPTKLEGDSVLVKTT